MRRNEATAARRALAALVRERLAELPLQSRRILTIAALLGYRIDRPLLAACAGTDDEGAQRALAAARKAGLVIEAGGTLRFRHALTQAAVCEGLDAAEARALHAHIAAVVERGADLPARFGQLAHHWAHAGEPAIAQAYATLMAREAGRGG
jgi:predicted ATPase